MNWSKTLLGGVAAGIVLWLANFVMHAVIMAGTYREHAIFGVDPEPSPFWFLLIAILIAIFGAILFAKTRQCWGDGFAGGAIYGFWLGMVGFFYNFYFPLGMVGFPYFLSWCWGGIGVIGGVIAGGVLGLMIKKP